MKRNARILYEQNLDDFGHLDDDQYRGPEEQKDEKS